MIPSVLIVLFAILFTATSGLSEIDSFAIPREGESGDAVFFSRVPSATPTGVLLLMPGYNGAGDSMFDEGWCRFADEHALVLLAPTFQTSPEQLKRNQGYYYPEQGSGRQLEMALAEINRRTGVETDQIMIFGFSAGAHFAHRFALWKPERVRAFVAYSAGWWSDPSESLRQVPALIMCGESDSRHGATREFFEKAMVLDLPWMWRSYKETGHELTPAVRRMAEAFLAQQVEDLLRTGASERTMSQDEFYWGDIQTYRFVPADEEEAIPAAVRIRIPTRGLAEVWAREE
jgi:pimeloyl-ACP methyl ester carboxylesterase